MRRGKIVDTIGPASNSYETLKEMINAGMNIARLNRSHGTQEEHLVNYTNLRKAAQELNKSIGILVDLQGPKIRCGWFPKNSEGDDSIIVKEGDEFIITTRDEVGDEHHTSCTYKHLPQDCKVGDPILIDDGKVRLKVISIKDEDVHTRVEVGGPISSHKGINLPGTPVSLPALTAKDEEDLRWGIKVGADMIAMSFVRSAKDIELAHAIMDELGRRVPVIAKIEKPQAVENLEEIVDTFDGIMVARGDLAIEMSFEDVPIITKRCITLAREYAKPVIVATEVLGSMTQSPVPTRAEASDCANALLDGADATMTSNETAVGKYPVETVKTMARISEFATSHGAKYIPHDLNLSPLQKGIATHAATQLAEETHADAIVVFTASGRTANKISRLRPDIPIYAFTQKVSTCNWLTLSWGVEAFLTDVDDTTIEYSTLLYHLDQRLKEAHKVKSGDSIICVFGRRVLSTTDEAIVHHIVA